MDRKRTKEELELFRKVAQAIHDAVNREDTILEEYTKKAEDFKNRCLQSISSKSGAKKKPVGRPKKITTLETVSEIPEDKQEEETKRRGRKPRNAALKAAEVTKALTKNKKTKGGSKRKSPYSTSPDEPHSKSARKEDTLHGDGVEIIEEPVEVMDIASEAAVVTNGPLMKNCTVVIKRLDSVETQNHADVLPPHSSRNDNKIDEAKSNLSNIKVPVPDMQITSPNSGMEIVGKVKSQIQMEGSQVIGKSESPKNVPIIEMKDTTSGRNGSPLEGRRSSSRRKRGRRSSSRRKRGRRSSSHGKTPNKSPDQIDCPPSFGGAQLVVEETMSPETAKQDNKSSTTPENSSPEPVKEEIKSTPLSAIEKPTSEQTNVRDAVIPQRVTRSKRRKEPSNGPARDGDLTSPPSTEVQTNNLPESKEKTPTEDDNSGSDGDNPKTKKGSAIMKAQLFKQVADMFTPVGSNLEKENHFHRQLKTGEKTVTKATPLKNHNSFIPSAKFKTPPTYSSAKLKIATFEEAERRRKEEALRKKLKEEEAIRNRNERLKAKQEDIRRRNEEKMQKVAAFRAANKETEQRQAKLEEEKRKEEELRIKHLKEMEKLKKQRLEEQRLKEIQGKKAKEILKTKVNIIPLKDKDNYDIADITPDDDDCNDEDSQPKKEIPLWAKKGEDRSRHERMLSFVPMDVVSDFFACPGQTPDLTQFFGKMTMKRVRTSSAVWLETPPLKKH